MEDKTSTWLAKWVDSQGRTKYMYLSDGSRIKAEQDFLKFEKARTLKTHLPRIRTHYRKDIKRDNPVVVQKAVATALLDMCSYRAEKEKDNTKEADKVGVFSLRIKHVRGLHETKDGLKYVVDFNFLAKDSLRYEQSKSVGKAVFEKIGVLMEGKGPKEDLFESLTTCGLNEYLDGLMVGLTAKVFRTCSSSILLWT